MAIILPANTLSAGGYDVANSCRFNDGDSAYMEKSPASDGSNTTATFSAWVKRGNLGARQAIFGGQEGTTTAERCVMEFNASDQLVMQTGNGGSFVNKVSNRVFRDCSAWYHLVFQFDTTNGTAASRWKFFVNGVQETSLATDDTFPDSADIKFFENTTSCRIAVGMKPEGSSNVQFFDGYMAEVVVIDGSVLAPTEFGEFDSDSPTIWKPKDVSGLTFGTNGFYLDFEDSSNLGNDANGGTDLTETNLAAVDQATDTPTNSFATLNPLDNYYAGATFSQGNCNVVTGSGVSAPPLSTFGVANGKWYFECKPTAKGGGSDWLIGIASTQVTAASQELGHFSSDWAYYGSAGQYRNNDTTTSYDNSYTTNDIIGVALDLDNNKLYFSKNGTFQNSGDPASGATGTGALSITVGALGNWFAAASYWDSGTGTFAFNFGGCSAFTVSSANQDGNGYGNFEYAVPSGYYALCTKNLAEFGG